MCHSRAKTDVILMHTPSVLPDLNQHKCKHSPNRGMAKSGTGRYDGFKKHRLM